MLHFSFTRFKDSKHGIISSTKAASHARQGTLRIFFLVNIKPKQAPSNRLHG